MSLKGEVELGRLLIRSDVVLVTCILDPQLARLPLRARRTMFTRYRLSSESDVWQEREMIQPGLSSRLDSGSLGRPERPLARCQMCFTIVYDLHAVIITIPSEEESKSRVV